MSNKLVGRKRARQQATEMEKPDYVHAQGDYNIWYHKRLGDKPVKRQEVSTTRCDPIKDSGLTKADTLPGKHFLCLYFARGKCVHGHNCQYFHRLPLASDEESLPLTHDVFGRERHQTDREDMGGVGSFNRDNRTLYVGGIKTAPGVNLDKILYEQFSVWGEIEYVRVISSRMIAFIRYKLRIAAEFAKEAMGDQTLGLGDLLNIRWSHEDPNPAAKRYEEEAVSRTAATAILMKSKEQGVPEYLLDQYHAPEQALQHPYVTDTARYHSFVHPDDKRTNRSAGALQQATAEQQAADLSQQKQYFLQWAQFFAQQGIDPSQLDEQTILYYQQYYTYQYNMAPFYPQAQQYPLPSQSASQSESATQESESQSETSESAQKKDDSGESSPKRSKVDSEETQSGSTGEESAEKQEDPSDD